jgi:hypothetical protein
MTAATDFSTTSVETLLLWVCSPRDTATVISYNCNVATVMF